MELCVCLCISLSGGNREKTKPVLSADEKVKHAFYLTQHWADQVNEYKHKRNVAHLKNIVLLLVV